MRGVVPFVAVIGCAWAATATSRAQEIADDGLGGALASIAMEEAVPTLRPLNLPKAATRPSTRPVLEAAGESLFRGASAELSLAVSADALVGWRATDANVPLGAAAGAWHQDAIVSEWRPYGAVEQQVWRSNPGDQWDARGLSVFLSYKGTDARLFEAGEHLSAGVNWKGLMASRPADVIGVGVSYTAAIYDLGFADWREMAVDAFYQWQVAPGVVIQPDLQFIGGAGGTRRDDSIVLAVRLQITF